MRSAGAPRSAHISPFWRTWKTTQGRGYYKLTHTRTHTRTHAVTWPGLSTCWHLGKRECPAASWRTEIDAFIIFPPWQCRSYSGRWIETRSPGARERLHFKTMVALYVEVELVRRERGRPGLWKAVLMTGIHGRCQVQVEMWTLVEEGTDYFIFFPPNAKPGGLIQSITVFWGAGGLGPLCCK